MVLLILILTSSVSFGQEFLQKFISDTLYVQLKCDTIEVEPSSNINVQDMRDVSGSLLTIKQKNIYNYVPVDEYVILKAPVSEQLRRFASMRNLSGKGTLKIKGMSVWYDSKPLFHKRLILNAVTEFKPDSTNETESWLWEIPLKRHRKENDSSFYARVIETWLDSQITVISDSIKTEMRYPYRYRRQLIPWVEYIFLQDGYILNVHLTLYYPAGGNRKYIRGSAGMYYRRSSLHESIAVGGGDIHIYRRLSADFLSESYLTLRFGVNHFFREKIAHTEYYNLFMLNLSIGSDVQYRPRFGRGIFMGTGVHLNVNILPDILEKVEPGLFFTLGMVLP